MVSELAGSWRETPAGVCTRHTGYPTCLGGFLLSVKLLLWNFFPLWCIVFQPPPAHHTHSFLLKASLTFNALQLDLLDRSGRLSRLFEALFHVAMKEQEATSEQNEVLYCSLTMKQALFVYWRSTTLCGWTCYYIAKCSSAFITLFTWSHSVWGATEGCIHALGHS